MISELRTVDVWTPDPWRTPLPPLTFTRNGSSLSIFEAIGTTPDKTPTLNHFGVSGGKDSDAILAWALYESGYPRESIVASTCETFNEDPVTYEHLDLLRKLHPILRLIPGKGFWDLVKHKGMFPTRKKRFCTQFLKMEPTRYFVHALVDAGFKVLLHAGVRAEESPDRAKLDEYDPMDSFFALPIRRPMLRKTIKDIVELHHKYEIPFNPLYSMGARRVGCFPCINSVKNEMRLVAQYRPEKIDFISSQEVDLTLQTGNAKTFFHRKTVPIRFRTADFKDKKGETIKVASIHDVVQWALSGHRAHGRYDDQGELPGLTEKDMGVCSLTYGACE